MPRQRRRFLLAIQGEQIVIVWKSKLLVLQQLELPDPVAVHNW